MFALDKPLALDGAAKVTVALAFGGTLCCFLFAYPLAYLLATRGGSRRTLGLILVVIPFWTSFLIRTYAWLTILAPSGLLNGLLGALGLPPVQLLNGPGAVLIGIVYNYLPLMVFPIYVALERLDPALVEAIGARLGVHDLKDSSQRVIAREVRRVAGRDLHRSEGRRC